MSTIPTPPTASAEKAIREALPVIAWLFHGDAADGPHARQPKVRLDKPGGTWPIRVPLVRLSDAEAQLAELRADAMRYRWLRAQTAGKRDSRGRMEFDLPDPHPLGNIMQGSASQHLDAAIDAILAADGKDGAHG